MKIEYLNNKTKAKVLSLQHRREWQDYLNKLPEYMQDIYFTPDLYEVYENNGDGKACCFIFESENDIALYPFLMNKINDLGYELNDTFYDIQGIYGYNGIVYSNDSQDFKEKFFNEFFKFCDENNIVAELTKFHPLLMNYKFSMDFLDVLYDRQTIFLNLSKNYDEIFNNFHSSVRKNLAIADKNGLFCHLYMQNFPYKQKFIDGYRENMRKVNSRAYLFFTDKYFDTLFELPNLFQLVVFKEQLPIASSLCFFSNIYLHHHLTYSNSHYLSLKPNNFLLNEIIKVGINKGLKYLHLGGGRTNAPDDSLLSFKRNHSNLTSDFYIGKKIHNENIYNELINQWKFKYPHLIDLYKNFVLKYRFTS